VRGRFVEWDERGLWEPIFEALAQAGGPVVRAERQKKPRLNAAVPKAQAAR
jgi:hypothetical protein